MRDTGLKKTDCTDVKLPKSLCDRLIKFIETHEELGYEDVNEFVLNAVRDKMESYGVAIDMVKK